MTLFIREHDRALAPENIAILSHFDAVGRVHFRSSPSTSRAASRFAKIQAALLKGTLVAPSPTLHAALSLVLFDGIATKDDLSGALAGIDQMYHWDGRVCLDWIDPVGRQNRRHLGLITLAILAMPRTTAIDVHCTLQALDGYLQDVVRTGSRAYSLELLLLDAQAWLYEHLPPPLFAHCIGRAPIAALGRSTYARLESAEALSPKEGQEAKQHRSTAFAYAIGSYFSLGRDSQGGWFVDEIVRICRRKRSLSNTEDKQRMLQECKKLAGRDLEITPLCGLILAWIIDLLESGTRNKAILKAITPAKYVGAAAKRLWQVLQGKDLEEIGAAQFLDIYLGMMDGLSNPQKRTLASALSSWHFFLTCWFDIPPLYRPLHKWVPASAPKADVVWPHEIDMIRTWLSEPMADSRHQGQLRVAFEIASRVRIRASELLSLRLQNIHYDADRVTIEIATKAIDGGVKTLAAFRRSDTQSYDCLLLIEAWCQRRQREGAFPSDYLFGDPHRPERKYAPGMLYIDLNRLLKAATGDTSIALHALSHTRISMNWLAAALDNSVADINRFEQESVQVGHATAATGFASYFHLFESWLRTCLDRAIQTHFGRWSCINLWVGKTHDAYRQARSRARRQDPALTDEAFAARTIVTACPLLLLPRASAGFTLKEAVNPVVPTPPGPMSLSTTLDVLNDIAFGHAVETIAIRSNRSTEEILQLGRVAIDVLQDIGELDRRQAPRPGHRIVLELQAHFAAGIHARLQFQRVGQAKVGNLFDLIASSRQSEIVSRGIDAWERCYQRGYVSLESAGAAAPFVEMLDAADFPRFLIVIRSLTELKQISMAAFRVGKAGLPRWESIQLRPGRPKAYLALTTYAPQANGQTVGNAGLGMSGVHALFFAAAVRLRMSSFAPEPDT